VINYHLFFFGELKHVLCAPSVDLTEMKPPKKDVLYKIICLLGAVKNFSFGTYYYFIFNFFELLSGFEKYGIS
jgi:hypothetical protein